MHSLYYGFFERASKIYDSANGFCALSEIIRLKQIKKDSDRELYERLRGKLSEREYEIAATVLFNFFKRHNRNGLKDRILSISEEHKKDLEIECIEIEENFSSFLQSA